MHRSEHGRLHVPLLEDMKREQLREGSRWELEDRQFNAVVCHGPFCACRARSGDNRPPAIDRARGTAERDERCPRGVRAARGTGRDGVPSRICGGLEEDRRSSPWSGPREARYTVADVAEESVDQSILRATGWRWLPDPATRQYSARGPNAAKRIAALRGRPARRGHPRGVAGHRPGAGAVAAASRAVAESGWPRATVADRSALAEGARGWGR
jgi:hypothetical protein